MKSGANAVECRDVCVTLGGSPILRSLKLLVAEGEAVSVLGPSGSGKTTMMYAIAGFVDVASGEVWIDGRPVASEHVSTPPEERSVGMVFQNYALWPHLSAEDIVAYPLRRAGLSKRAVRIEVQRLLEMVGIDDLARRKPSQLSGGQQQRVGLARALARRPALYLFDEPTAHLDSALRGALQEELADQRRASGAAALFSTHDAAEALAVADRVAIIRGGEIVQTGTPVEIYERPGSLWAAQLTGPARMIEVAVVQADGAGAIVEAGGRRVSVPGLSPVGRNGNLVVRADWVTPGTSIDATVGGVWYRGPHSDYRLDSAIGVLEMRRPGPLEWSRGDRLTVDIVQGWLVDG